MFKDAEDKSAWNNLLHWCFALQDKQLELSNRKMSLFKKVPTGYITSLSDGIQQFYSALNKDDLGAEKEREYKESIAATSKVLEEARKRAREEGREEGVEEGAKRARNQKNVEIAKRMHSKGKSKEDIAETLEIPVEDVEKLISD